MNLRVRSKKQIICERVQGTSGFDEYYYKYRQNKERGTGKKNWRITETLSTEAREHSISIARGCETRHSRGGLKTKVLEAAQGNFTNNLYPEAKSRMIPPRMQGTHSLDKKARVTGLSIEA
jgi:hypothetical protein